MERVEKAAFHLGSLKVLLSSQALITLLDMLQGPST